MVARTRPVGPILVQSGTLVHAGVLLVFCMHQTRLLVFRMRQGDADVPRGELAAGKAVPEKNNVKFFGEWRR